GRGTKTTVGGDHVWSNSCPASRKLSGGDAGVCHPGNVETESEGDVGRLSRRHRGAHSAARRAWAVAEGPRARVPRPLLGRLRELAYRYERRKQSDENRRAGREPEKRGRRFLSRDPAQGRFR